MTQQLSDYRATIVPWNKLAMNQIEHLLFLLRQLVSAKGRQLQLQFICYAICIQRQSLLPQAPIPFFSLIEFFQLIGLNHVVAGGNRNT